MKKILLVLIVLLLLVGAAAGYYVFFMQPEEVKEQQSEQAPPAVATEKKPILDLEAPAPEITEYYVVERRISVHNKPQEDALVVDHLYKGEKLTILEKQLGWGRITDYLVYEEGGEETAEWVNMTQLSNEKPVIEEMERLEILDGYIARSDDLLQHQEVFRKHTQQLLNDGTCKPQDFEELGGWVRSVTFQPREVYFIYCGGLDQENKIYLDINSGDIFYR